MSFRPLRIGLGPVINQGDGFKHVLFSPLLGKWCHLTNIFQMGWNHQPEMVSNPPKPTTFPKLGHILQVDFWGPFWAPKNEEHVVSHGRTVVIKWVLMIINHSQVSNEKRAPGWLDYMGDFYHPCLIGIITTHYKDPYINQPGFNGKYPSVLFVAHIMRPIGSMYGICPYIYHKNNPNQM